LKVEGSTRNSKRDPTTEKPELGILLISPEKLYFFEEKPNMWQNLPDLSSHQIGDKIRQAQITKKAEL
jgi:hypothetical protein